MQLFQVKNIVFGLSSLLMFTGENQVKKDDSISKSIDYVVTHLDSASFQTVRDGWRFDYGLESGGTLNTFEYIRSLMTYGDFQNEIPQKIFISGPHSESYLNLTSQNSFGHYNPKFVKKFERSVRKLMEDKKFVDRTRFILNTYNIIGKIDGYLEIYNIIQNNKTEFESFRDSYLVKIQNGTWEGYDYRTYLPTMLDTGQYWNWSETNYYFWVRRDIDGTIQNWHKIMLEIKEAYKE